MSDLLEINSRMPFMRFNWSLHSTRVGRLSLTERGLFDAVRTELWMVVGCKMPRANLLARLRMKEDSRDAKMLDRLVTFNLLTQDPDGMLYDPMQVQEFAEAMQKAAINKENGAKGGRPRKSGPPVPQPDDHDF